MSLLSASSAAFSKLSHQSPLRRTSPSSYIWSPPPHGRVVVARASPVPAADGVELEGELELPRWAGETSLSRFIGALISFKPLFSVMKLGARQLVIGNAEKADIPWREMTNEILNSDVYKEMESVQNPSLVYPDYYLNPFHAYDEGNLSWLAAAEAEAATMSIAKLAVPDAPTVDEANKIVRGNWLKAIEDNLKQYSGNSEINDILDIGCSIGVSTRYLAEMFPSANVTGLDLSPYFLSVAQYKDKKKAARIKPIRWIHANGECTGLPSNSFDLVSLAYVLHECPQPAIIGLVNEAFRLLRPGGTIAVTDNSPKSKVLQELSPAKFTLLKSTEPFLDEYYLLDLEKTMRDAGFVSVRTIMTSPRHRTVTATALSCPSQI
ncbi:hypothetical protein OPV22_010365 [Ensete ventricosum]|uniref:Methyltransferase type 11 domain-containing protein n=1 Tax=Ensete ventricosum TaxID=4639 RepID=A0AAV8RL20_ENSVE|nr:hypothetical protein OPV22_010365 [Ensete ventricosum]